MTLTRDEAKTVLDPYLPTIAGCVDSAIKDYHRLDPEGRARFQKRTKASIINDFMTFAAAQQLRELPGVRLVRRQGHLVVLIGDKFRLKFKKLSPNLQPSNIETQSVLAFMNQQQEEFPHMPSPLTHIIAGYSWKDATQTVAGIHMVCPDGKRNSWELAITVEPIAVETTVAESAAKNTAYGRPRRVTPK